MPLNIQKTVVRVASPWSHGAGLSHEKWEKSGSTELMLIGHGISVGKSLKVWLQCHFHDFHTCSHLLKYLQHQLNMRRLSRFSCESLDPLPTSSPQDPIPGVGGKGPNAQLPSIHCKKNLKSIHFLSLCL